MLNLCFSFAVVFVIFCDNYILAVCFNDLPNKCKIRSLVMVVTLRLTEFLLFTHWLKNIQVFRYMLGLSQKTKQGEVEVDGVAFVTSVPVETPRNTLLQNVHTGTDSLPGSRWPQI